MSALVSVLAAVAFFGVSDSPPAALPDLGAKPTINLSAIREIHCGNSRATGFMIADNTLATAYHVTDNGGCVDAKTREPLRVYVSEREHDFVLAQVDLKLPVYIDYDCSRYVTGVRYGSYGYSSYLQTETLFRQSDMQAYPEYSGPGFIVKSIGELPNLRRMYGPMVFGHSGGPVINYTTGKAHGMNNVGLTTFFGMYMTGHAFSTELADTILCRRPTTAGTSPSS